MKLLIVDDDPEIRDLCERCLKAAGYAASAVETCEQAAVRLGEGWDVALIDPALPGAIDGHELARRVTATTGADVVLLAAPTDLQAALGALKGGTYDLVLKPFTEETLLLALRRCMEKRRMSQELARERILRAELDRAYYELAQMEKVKETFGQFATPDIAKLVLAHPDDFWKRGERKVVSVLFADVRGFTAFAGRVPPEEVVWALNDIFTRVIAAVQRENGIVNKFIGDGLMAIFGAPVANGDHARSAARAALRARTAVDELAESRRKLDLEPLRVGVGVNTGEVVCGCLGTKERAEYSVIGHAVNLAARLEESAAPGQVLLGPETARRLGADFEWRELPPLSFQGIPAPVIPAELVREKPTV